ncbi:MAG: hypothetical protein KDA24_11835 [Deltaproteobacteria bacterium]|nr:hypothetical protein [Deltaproteobacteria bacterium]
MRFAPRVLLLAAAPLAACTLSVQPSEDTPPPSTYVAGTVSIEDPTGADEAGGPTFVFRYDCSAPPPPEGSGRPVDFLVIDEGGYDRGEAAFSFPQVPADTCFIINGFIDRDGDFDPFVTIANQVTAGDLAIPALTATVGGLTGDAVEPVVDLALTASLPVPLDRPAFVALDALTGESGGAMSIGPVVGTTSNAIVRLEATTIESSLTNAVDPTFTIVFAEDTDDNGWPDDNNGDGLPDIVWPRVLFLRLADADPSGLTTTDPPLVLPGVVLPLDITDSVNLETNRVLQSKLAGLPFDGEQVLPVDGITVVVPPLVVTDLATATTAPIEDVRAGGTEVLGQYQILVMNSTGQTWALPNELAAADESQGARFTVAEPAEPLPPRTLVAGTVSTGDGTEPGGPVVLTAFDCAAPPPPEGTGSPVDLATINPSAFVDGVATFAFGEVAAESCLIITGYIDVDRTFAALYSISQLPTDSDIQLTAEIVNVGPADENGMVAPVTDVAVEVLGEVVLEPPAFTVVGPDAGPVVMTRSATVGATDTVLMTLVASPHTSPMLETAESFFTFEFAPDADGNGLPDDFNGDGVPDVLWPRVLVLKGDPADPEGLDTVDPPVVLPGIVLPLDTTNAGNLSTNLALQSAIEGVGFPGGIGLFDSLTVAVPGLVVTDLATATTAPIESVALSGVEVDGDYTVLVMNATGQTWQVPNESILFGSETQGSGFRVEPPDADADPLGAISGSITTADGSDPGGRTILFRFDCATPPPPEGSGLPLDFTILPASDWSEGAVDFRFAGLPAGSCQLLTGFIDRDGDWDGLYGTANQASAGDFAMGALVINVPVVDQGSGLVPEIVNQGIVAGLSVPLERPSFTVLDIASGGTSDPTMTLGASPGDTESVFLQITAADVDSPVCSSEGPLFTFTFAPDTDADGTPEDFNGDGLPDVVWPRVFARRLDTNDPAGLAVQEPNIVLPGIIVPLDPTDPFNPASNLVIQQTIAGIPFDGTSLFPQTTLTVAIPGLVVTDAATATTAPIEAVAATTDVVGEYQILLMNSSGQTWSLPNEAALFEVAGQDAVFVVE